MTKPMLVIMTMMLLGLGAQAQAAPKPGLDYAICSEGVSNDNDEPCYAALARCPKRYAKGSKGYVKCRAEARRMRLDDDY